MILLGGVMEKSVIEEVKKIRDEVKRLKSELTWVNSRLNEIKWDLERNHYSEYSLRRKEEYESQKEMLEKRIDELMQKLL